MTIVANFLCENPKSKVTWKVYGNKCSKHSSGHDYCSFNNPDKNFKTFAKRPAKINSLSRKTISLHLFRQNFFSLNLVFWTNRMQFWQRCSSFFAKLPKNLCAQNEKQPVSFLRKVLSLLFSFEHVTWFFDNTGEYLLPKTLNVSAQFQYFSKNLLFMK